MKCHICLFLNPSRGGDSPTSLGSLFQCLGTPAVKKCFCCGRAWHPVLSCVLVNNWGHLGRADYLCRNDQGIAVFWVNGTTQHPVQQHKSDTMKQTQEFEKVTDEWKDSQGRSDIYGVTYPNDRESKALFQSFSITAHTLLICNSIYHSSTTTWGLKVWVYSLLISIRLPVALL